MSTIYLKVVNSNGVLQQSKTFVPTRSGSAKIKVTGSNGAYVPYPSSVPSVSATLSSLVAYSNTAQMLANDATTYANATNYAALVAANAYANAVAYAANAAANVAVDSLTDVVLETSPPANNSTLVYSSANNKYVVRQMDLDGGSF